MEGILDRYILPGFIDSHIHTESSRLTPSEFGRAAAIHGTVGAICDPHEIANVLGISGINFMIESSRKTPFKFYFGAPSCVPATFFETSGAELGVKEIEELLDNNNITHLSEVMNYPGVINKKPNIMAKIDAAKKRGKPIDGHAPGIIGKSLIQYASAGITTDHESESFDEAKFKIENGIKILIREGSVAKNFDELLPLIKDYPDKCMFCTDDINPNELLKGHINLLVKRAIKKGYDLMDVLQCASLNPVQHYKLNIGLLQENDPADFIIVNNLKDFDILECRINGQIVSKNGKSMLPYTKEAHPNVFNALPKNFTDFTVKGSGSFINVIGAINNQLHTEKLILEASKNGDIIQSDIKRDILKITVVNRYKNLPPAVGFIKNIGLKEGAIASSVAHDSHNIIAVGTNDIDICNAVNLIIENKGGFAAVSGEIKEIFRLPIAGLMSELDVWEASYEYSKIVKFVKEIGAIPDAPFATLSFMALLVIPKLKLSDKGLFDSENFNFTELLIKK